MMIHCIGTLISPIGTLFVDPIINVYYLSYNPVSGIIAFPQIIDTDLYPDVISIIENLNGVNILEGQSTNGVDRVEITNIVLMALENEYPTCQFFII